jgi:hypothetical protein
MSTHTALKTAFIFMSLTVLGGCSASMQVVRKDARGGEIAVWGATMPAQAQARHAMLEHCQGRFAVAALRDHHGLGASDAISLPSEAQVLSYRCASASRTLASNHTTLAQSE